LKYAGNQEFNEEIRAEAHLGPGVHDIQERGNHLFQVFDLNTLEEIFEGQIQMQRNQGLPMNWGLLVGLRFG